ncbi:flagellar export protein FliJ [Paenibacillus antri]|uniref:Flagellar FliJ protein n=1 Tax=Paenibacillus antri TaxID=2582848 RepID=A0A5R9G0K3_9BACL|nr:flagellar export protein FliJ [Paenibacillus antri]TLS49847.1 flagellar export protein FliJ [Paenibacillus antri]
MKFVYAFQKVLDVKTNEKKQAESLLSQAIGAMTQAERELSDLMLAKYRYQEKLADDATKGRPMADMIAGQQYVDHLEERIRTSKRALLTAEKAVNELREKLTDRSVDEKVWLNMKDRAFAVHRAEVERRSQYELDEMAALRSRFAR